jgi:DNA repair protein RadC
MVREVAELEFQALGRKLSDARKVAGALSFLANRTQEEFWVLLLDGRHALMSLAQVSKGTATSSLVHPREVFGPAVRESAAAVIVAHNHPSGDPNPSVEDREVTRRLRAAADLIGIPLLDHVVLGSEGAFYSFAQSGDEAFK